MVCTKKWPGLKIKLFGLAWDLVPSEAALYRWVSSQLLSMKHAHHQTPVSMSDIPYEPAVAVWVGEER
jgi:hypothetical protein